MFFNPYLILHLHLHVGLFFWFVLRFYIKCSTFVFQAQISFVSSGLYVCMNDMFSEVRTAHEGYIAPLKQFFCSETKIKDRLNPEVCLLDRFFVL